MTTRIRHSELLEHPVRVAVYDLVKETPGIAFLDLYRQLRPHPEFGRTIGYGNLLYHLRRLEQFGLITNRKSARHRRYYQNGGPWGGGTSGLALLQTPPLSKLARILVERPGASQTELWSGLNLQHACSRQIVGYHLDRLVQQELVVVGRRVRGKAYFATERLLELLRFVREPPAASVPPAAFAVAAVAVEG